MLPEAGEELRLMHVGVGGKAKVVRLSWPLRLLVPSLLLRSASKRALGFAYLRDDVTFALAGVVSALWIGVSAVGWGFLGWPSVGLFSWIFGTTAVLLLVNALGPGVVFIKSLCSTCEFRDLITAHETLHLEGVVSEAKVWSVLRSRFGTDASALKLAATICPHCPIPERLSGHEAQGS